MATLDPGTVDSSYWSSQAKLDQPSNTQQQMWDEYQRQLAAAPKQQPYDYSAGTSFGGAAAGSPVLPPVPSPAPAPGIIAGAQGGPSFGPGSTGAPSPSPAPAGPTGAGIVSGAAGNPSFGPTTTGTPAPAPANANAVKSALGALQWAGQGKDAASAQAIYNQALQNGWSLDDLGQGNGTNADWWKALFSQYNLNTATGSFGPGNGTGAPAAPAAPGGGGIIASQTKSAAQLGNPTDWNVTPEQTVEGRIQSILNPNSPIIAQARARSLDQMNARGLANSSLAVTAGESAAYDAAIPIAQADAATFAKAAGYNADQKNQFARENVTSENQFRLQGMNNDAQRDLALINRDTQLQLSKLNADQQQLAAKLELDNQRLLQTNGKAAEAFNTAMSAINNVNMNDKMDADTKTRTVASIWRDTQIQLNTLGRVAGLNLTQDLDFANMPGFNDKGMYVGFEDGAGAVTRASAPAGIVAGAQGQASNVFPPSVNGQPVNWDQPDNLGKTPRTYYQNYKDSGGTLSPEQWLLFGSGTGSGSNGGPGNPSSSPNANSSSTPSAADGSF
jgi:hypothetical protein